MFIDVYLPYPFHMHSIFVLVFMVFDVCAILFTQLCHQSSSVGNFAMVEVPEFYLDPTTVQRDALA